MTSGWAVILAGGDGTRLRALTHRISGDDRRKLFCPVLGDDTLLDQTRHRVARLVEPDRTLFLLTRFSRMVLSPRPDVLAVLPVKGVDWNDLGHPARVDAVLACATR